MTTHAISENASTTVHVLVGHAIEELHRIEGRLLAFQSLVRTISGLIGDELVAEHYPSPTDCGIELALASVRDVQSEARRFLRAQALLLREPAETFEDFARSFPDR